MPNPYFRFKEFVVRQDKCAMKVCTDSCILGAWTTQRSGNAEKILDIGSGTGLLPLMLAQKLNCLIDTIESDPQSSAQAIENINASPWPNRIHLIEADVRKYSFPTSYDFIIANPPFYEYDLRSPEQRKNKAKHDESLTMEELIKVIRANLKKESAFSILLPFHRTEYFEKMASANGFYLLEKLIIRQTPEHSPFRSICLFGFQKSAALISDELLIKNEIGEYTPEFKTLMQDYY